MSNEIIQNMFFSMHVHVRNLRQPRLSCFLAILNATLLLPFYEANGCCPISLLNWCEKNISSSEKKHNFNFCKAAQANFQNKKIYFSWIFFYLKKKCVSRLQLHFYFWKILPYLLFLQYHYDHNLENEILQLSALNNQIDNLWNKIYRFWKMIFLLL